MKIGLLTPTRGDRSKFLEHAKYLMAQQTLQADHIEIVDDVPKSRLCDITYRYKIGCYRLFQKGVDVILFWEDDDHYAPNYIETMINTWVKAGKTDIFGIAQTIYYHLGLKKYITLNHPDRASMMNTMISKNAKINWGNDNYAFTDLVLWKQLKHKATFIPHEILSLGIKHGIGMSGGSGHKTTFKYTHDDENLEYLQKTVDQKSFEFYRSIQS
jgi:hypothetical protein